MFFTHAKARPTRLTTSIPLQHQCPARTRFQLEAKPLEIPNNPNERDRNGLPLGSAAKTLWRSPATAIA